MRRAVMALAMLGLVTGCAEVLPGAVGTPHDATAVFRPASMVADRETVSPGEVVELSFPDEMTRGVWFVLEREVGTAWEYRYDLTSDGPGPEWPMGWHLAGGDGFTVEDIGVGGAGPDRITIPPEAEPGSWRICTGNAGENVCVRIEITPG